MKKGFTLAEVIISLILLSMVGIIVGIVFNTMFAGRGLIDKEASIQAELRTSMQVVDKTVQNATAVFILDDSEYSGNKSKLTKEWSYMGLSEDGKKILDYRWNKTKKDWDVKELGVKSLYGLKLNMVFDTEGDYQDNRLVKLNLNGKYPKTNNKFSLDTAITALNAKQVFSKVNKGKKGVAIAYRNDPIEGLINISVSFVFDISGSMQWNMQGQPIKNRSEPSRMNILIEKSKLLVDDLEKVGNVSVNLVGFNELGQYIQEDFVNLDNGTSTIYQKIDKLNPGGGTNPGDGLRYGLASLQKNSAQLKYVVLLTDGVPNMFTIGSYDTKTPHRPYPLYTNPTFDLSENFGNKGSKDIYYKGNFALPEAITYAEKVTEKFGKGVRRISVIGFSANPNDTSQGQNLTNGIGKSGIQSDYTDATSQEQLQEVFSRIKKQIEQDKWFVTGP
ncbi:MAG: VWA domain-containing protein [Streptococcus sp.]|nr:VWA domain-containing protein [Streptococcus sp.]